VVDCLEGIDAKPSPRRAVHLHPCGLALTVGTESTVNSLCCFQNMPRTPLAILREWLSVRYGLFNFAYDAYPFVFNEVYGAYDDRTVTVRQNRAYDRAYGCFSYTFSDDSLFVQPASDCLSLSSAASFLTVVLCFPVALISALRET